MLSNKRRFTIIFLAVAAGSLLSFLLVKKRMGQLSQQEYVQLGFNFFFAVAIVFGVALIFRKNK